MDSLLASPPTPVPIRDACTALGLSRASLHRRQRQKDLPPAAPSPQPSPPRALDSTPHSARPCSTCCASLASPTLSRQRSTLPSTISAASSSVSAAARPFFPSVSGDRVNPSTGDTRNPSTLRSRERHIAGSIERISAWQGWAETGDEDAGRGGGDAAASRVGLGYPSDCGGDRLQPGDGAAISGCRWLDTLPGSNPTGPADGPFNLAG